MTKILVLYAATGGGHRRAAEAIAEELRTTAPDVSVSLRDGLARSGSALGLHPSAEHDLLSTRLLPLYNAFYRATDHAPGAWVRRQFVRLRWGAALRSLVEEESPDLIVSTHFFLSPSCAAPLSRRIPFVVVVTDLVRPHPLWFDPRADWVLTPTAEAEAHARRFVPDPGRVVMAGYPLRRGFTTPAMGKGRTNTLLVLGGGAGSGGIELTARHLLRALPEARVVVLCGTNTRAQHALAALGVERLDVHGFADEPERQMREADIILTKAGPGTIVEAAALGTPVLLTGWVGWQERENVRFVLEQDLGLYCPNPGALQAQVRRVYQEYYRYAVPRAWATGGARRIAEHLLRLC